MIYDLVHQSFIKILITLKYKFLYRIYATCRIYVTYIIAEEVILTSHETSENLFFYVARVTRALL